MKKIILRVSLGLILIVIVIAGNLIVFNKQASRISQGKPIDKTAFQNSALLVIDIQEGTTGEFSANESYKKDSDALIQRINGIIEKSVENKIPVVYIRNEVSNPLVNLINSSLARGSRGADIDRRLKVVSDHTLSKEKQDAFSNAKLDSLLVKNRVGRLFITGLDAAYCVNSTLIAAKNRGYEVSVIGDAVISETDSLKDRMFKEFADKNIQVLSTGEFLRN
jgi:nicotinamidase/pyrazinamidase